MIDMVEHPVFAKVTQHLFEDQGMEMPTTFVVDEVGQSDLPLAERYLRTLNEYELETFCIGDQEDQKQMVANAGDKEGAEAADRILEAMFFTLIDGGE